jgi:excinuclease ABC subunit C
MADLRRQISLLPRAPGLYLFVDAHGRVLYVGKATCLRSRVGSYFQASATLARKRSAAISRMIERDVARIEHVPCRSEADAARRESRLIKDLQPPRNIAQKLDRRWPYVQLTAEAFPQVSITRDPLPLGARLYGPVWPRVDYERALSVLGRLFGLRVCQRPMGAAGPRPCLRLDLGQCCAPCGGAVTSSEYAAGVARLRAFMRSPGATTRQVAAEMAAARAAMNYERAAALRDTLTTLKQLSIRRRMRDVCPPRPPRVDARRTAASLAAALGLPRPPRVIAWLHCLACGRGLVGLGATFVDGAHYRPLVRIWRLSDAARPLHELAGLYVRAVGEACRPELVMVDDAHAARELARDVVLCGAVAAAAMGPGRLWADGRCVEIAGRRQAWALVRSVRDECRRIARLLTAGE